MRRTARANGGKALGVRRFEAETGIGEADWGNHWARFSEAVAEAGLSRNTLTEARPEEDLLEPYAKLAAKLGRVPTVRDVGFALRKGAAHPHWSTLDHRFGGKAGIIAKLREYCDSRPEYAVVAKYCNAHLVRTPTGSEPEDAPAETNEGFVYLMKSGRHYKIGRANSSGRRQYELAIQLPEKLTLVHQIKTVDPVGVEAYWHNRFAEKRKNGEWFALTAADVKEFKGWRKIM